MENLDCHEIEKITSTLDKIINKKNMSELIELDMRVPKDILLSLLHNTYQSSDNACM